MRTIFKSAFAVLISLLSLDTAAGPGGAAHSVPARAVAVTTGAKTDSTEQAGQPQRLPYAGAAPEDETETNGPVLTGWRGYDEEHPLVYEDYWDLYPYSFIDEHGKPDGYNVELVKKLLGELDIPYKIRLTSISDAYADFPGGNNDLILSICADKRKQYGRYGNVSVVIFTTSLLTPKTKMLPEVTRVRELGDNRVITHTGSVAYDAMVMRGMKDNAVAVGDMTQTIINISRNDSGAVLWNTMSMKYIIYKYKLNNLVLSPIRDLHTDLRFMARDTVLLHKIDSTYLAHYGDRDYVALRQKWFYPETTRTVHPFMWIAACVLAFFTLVAIVTFIYYRLMEKRQLKRYESLNRQLPLYLNASSITLWTYKVDKKVFAVVSDTGEECEEVEARVFSEGFDDVDFAEMVLGLEQLSVGDKTTCKVMMRKIVDDGNGNTSYAYYDVLLSVLERDRRRRPLTILGTQTDITNEQRKMIERQESALKFRSAFNISTSWIFCFNRYGQLTSVNLAACSELGIYDTESLMKAGFTVGDLPLDLDLGKDGSIVDTEMWMTSSVDYDWLRAEGKLNENIKATGKAYYEVVIMPVRDSIGGLIATYVAGINMTDSVETVREVMASREKHAAIYRRALIGMEHISHALTFAKIRMCDYSRQKHTFEFTQAREQKPITQVELLRLTQKEDRRAIAKIMNALDCGSIGNLDFDWNSRLPYENGGTHSFNVRIISMQNDGGNGHYIVLTRDISAMRNMQAELAQQTVRAQEGERIKNAFLRNISAEIRKPLEHMFNRANELQAKGDEAGCAFIADDIRVTCQNLLALVGDILNLSKIEAGMVKPVYEDVDIAVFFPAICQMSSSALEGTPVAFYSDIPYESIIVHSDSNILSKIIESLIKCSIHTTNTGYVKASFEYFHGTFVIRVEDTGCGLTPEQMKAMEYHRFSGEGGDYNICMKLSIVRELARTIGGHMDIESMPGRGTTIWISVPCTARNIKLLSNDNDENA